jgi:hypothetical protein
VESGARTPSRSTARPSANIVGCLPRGRASRAHHEWRARPTRERESSAAFISAARRREATSRTRRPRRRRRVDRYKRCANTSPRHRNRWCRRQRSTAGEFELHGPRAPPRLPCAWTDEVLHAELNPQLASSSRKTTCCWDRRVHALRRDASGRRCILPAARNPSRLVPL